MIRRYAEWPLRRKLTAQFLCTALLLIPLTAATVAAISETQGDLVSIDSERTQVSLMSDIQQLLYEQIAAEKLLVLTGDLAHDRQYRERSARVGRNLETLISMSRSEAEEDAEEGESEVVEGLRGQVAAHDAAHARVVAMTRAGERGGPALAAMTQADAAARRVIETLDRTMATDHEETGEAIEKLLGDTRMLIITLLVGSLVAFAISLWLGQRAARAIIDPITHATGAAERIASGRLRETMPVLSRDETGRLAESFNRMAEDLRGLIFPIQETTLFLSNSGSDLALVSAEASDSLQELSSAIDGINQGAQEQAHAVSRGASVIAEVAGVVDDVGASAGEVARSARETAVLAQHGGTTIARAVEGLSSVRETTLDASEKMKALDEQSVRVSEFAGMISRIAEQTNLLALNAAIEAARAGDHGRGFAVVADEVRKLSEDAARAAASVAGTVSTMREGVDGAVKAMERGRAEVEDRAAAAREAGEALHQLLASLERTNGQVHTIVADVRSIAPRMKQVAELMDGVAAITEENAASSQEMAAMSEQFAGIMGRISQMAGAGDLETHSLPRATERLRQLTVRFEV